jgi:2-succinyl-5-enolpyruvyl-6-hydroxy-3-cyclohexene-1-carboxylate synthase
MNISLANNILHALADIGVSELILCAGARNSPFLYLLDNQESFQIYNFFEERSAAFFALGRIQSSKKPVAIITTSGTAAAELLPATIEAYYSGLPLLLITADRPAEYRGSGAPQSIEQMGLYSQYAKSVDIFSTKKEFAELSNWSKLEPLHLNVCFKEPLIDETPLVKKWNVIGNQVPVRLRRNTGLDSSISAFENEGFNFEETLHPDWQFFISRCKKPLVIVSGLNETEVSVVHEVLAKYSGPIYFESLSGLRGHSYELKILAGETFLKRAFQRNYFDGVIRIGSIPTTRIWRDLEESLAHLPVLSLSPLEWTGLGRNSLLVKGFDSLPTLLNIQSQCQWDSQIRLLNRFYFAQIQKLLSLYPSSEAGMIFNFSKLVKSNPMYLGNSLPIREWDAYASFETGSKKLNGNRGANGIDGQISTYLGWSRDFEKSFSLFGDLTTLYDLTSLWVSDQIPHHHKVIAVMNNGGGLIFEKMFGKEIFLNRHKIQFKNWATMWSWSYNQWQSVPDNFSFSGFNVIELNPDLKQTKLFQEKLDELWNKEL